MSDIKLNQVEGVLHALFSGTGRTARIRVGQRPSARLHNQIKRLLEIDRKRLREVPDKGRPLNAAFFANLPDGRGTDASYDAFGVFALAVALELLRFGFKQGEVVGKVAHLRDKLEQAHKKVTSSLQSQGSTYEHRAENNAQEPGRPYVFLVIDPLEPSDEGGALNEVGKGEDALCWSWDDVQRYLKSHMPAEVRS